MLTLEKALKMINAAFAEGKRLKLGPLSAAVLDAAGHVVATQRQDDTFIIALDASIAKAYGALSLKMSSRDLETLAKERPELAMSLCQMLPGKMLMAAGGCLIKSDGVIIGALGISGDTSDNDELCALAGIKAAGL